MTELRVAASTPLDVLAYVTAPDAAVATEVLTPLGAQLLAAAATPQPRDEIERRFPGAGPMIASWLQRSILVAAS